MNPRRRRHARQRRHARRDLAWKLELAQIVVDIYNFKEAIREFASIVGHPIPPTDATFEDYVLRVVARPS